MIPAIFYTDFYKTDHRRQYPKGTTKIYSNFTARQSRIPGVDHVVVFGVQYFLRDFLARRFSQSFFNRKQEEVLKEYQDVMDKSLGAGAITTEHLAQLHDLGYLPLLIKALPEGTICPIKTPILTITNTHTDFFWLPNFMETILSNVLWHPITSATIAFEYRKILEAFAKKTSDMPEFVKWQGHDFSMRGHTSFESSLVSGAAHLLSFTGTDTIPSILWLNHFYHGEDVPMVGGSVPATEHSVMSLGGKETEAETYKRLITEVYPKGIVSIVSDTWNYWNVLSETLPSLKSYIMARDGKVVIRPDSGDPVKIICGDPSAPEGSPQRLGTMQVLWNLFGGRVNAKGYKQLDPHIGVIYGDSITLSICREICSKLQEMGFASTNMVYGIGSYTYQYVSRDTFGFAMKATYGEINGDPYDIFKDPATCSGFKKSAKGLLHVDSDTLELTDQVSKEMERQGALKVVFNDGLGVYDEGLLDIRQKIDHYFLKDK